MRVKVTLRCSECKQRNYNTMKNKKNDPDRLEMKKYSARSTPFTTRPSKEARIMAEVKKENWFKRTWGKVKKYFRELRSELKKVVWPTPQQVLKNTAIVACCVVAVGVFIWLFDFVAQVGIDALIGLFH